MPYKDPAVAREQYKKYYKANREARLAASARWWRANRKHVYELNKRWRKENPEKDTSARLGRALKKFGLTKEQYDQMLLEQGGACAICRRPPTGRTKVLSIDHDHQTLVVRGLLCAGCNLRLGWFEKQQGRVATYLAKGRVK